MFSCVESLGSVTVGKMSVTLCWPKVDETILSFQENKVTGFAAEFVEEALEISKTQFVNISVVWSEKYGDIVDQKEQRYDGCIGELQNNRSDIVTFPTSFPLMAPNITNGVVFMSTKTTIVSAYSNTFENLKTDVMQCFAAFDISLWLLVVLSVVILVTLQLLTIRVRVRRRSKKEPVLSYLQTVLTAAVLKQFSGFTVRSSRFSVRLMLALTIVFLFLTHFFFASMIKTEMVVMKSPETISNYEEVLEQENCKPVWIKSISSHYEFADADPNSHAGKIWEKAKKIGFEKCLFGMTTDSLIVLVQLAKHTAVIFLPDFVVETGSLTACSILRKQKLLPDANIWYRTDPEAKEQLMTNLRSTKASKEIGRRIDLLGRRIAKSGFQKYYNGYVLIDLGKGAPHSEVEDCMANRILYPHHELQSVDVRHFTGLWKTLGIGFCLVIIAWIFENHLKHVFPHV